MKEYNNEFGIRLSDIQEEDFTLFMKVIKNNSKSSEAYQQLFEKHEQFIKSIINKKQFYLKSNTQTNTKDIFSRSILKMIDKVSKQKYKYDGRATFRSYIFQVYRFTASEVARMMKGKNNSLLSIEEENAKTILSSTHLEISQYKGALNYALQKVENALHRKVLQCVYMDAGDIITIAQKFNIKPVTVRQIKSRTNSLLRREVKKYAMYLPSSNR